MSTAQNTDPPSASNWLTQFEKLRPDLVSGLNTTLAPAPQLTVVPITGQPTAGGTGSITVSNVPQTSTPIAGQYSGPSAYQIALALLALYLVMRYLPKGAGIWIGWLILLGVFLSTSGASSAFSRLVSYVETGVS